MKYILLLFMGWGLIMPVALLAQTRSKPAASSKKKPSASTNYDSVTQAATASPTSDANAQAGSPGGNTSVGGPVANPSGKDVVAIYPFTSATGYEYDYAESVGNAIESGFVRSNRFTVVERNRFGAMKDEDRFKEANTADVVRVAARFGAKFIVTGHITGASTGTLHDPQGRFSGYQTSISLSFKIIEVSSGEIKVTESLNLAGSGGSTPAAKGAAYGSIDGITRRIIASYFPQRFPFMAVLTKDTKKRQGEILTSFKIWGGSDQGLKVGDMVEVYSLSEIMNPVTHKMVQEKQLVGAAEVAAINSGTTATCTVYKPGKYGKPLLDLVTASPDKVAVEYTGGVKPKSFWDSL